MYKAPDQSVFGATAQGSVFLQLREQGMLKKVNLFGCQKSMMAWSHASAIHAAEPIA